MTLTQHEQARCTHTPEHDNEPHNNKQTVIMRVILTAIVTIVSIVINDATVDDINPALRIIRNVP